MYGQPTDAAARTAGEFFWTAGGGNPHVSPFPREGIVRRKGSDFESGEEALDRTAE